MILPPAARLGDLTSHGTPLGPGPGSTNVMIGGRPAWRATVDMHLCPRYDGKKPHIGGKVSNGSKTVFINSMPAARLGDKVDERRSPNSIVGGHATVVIGG